MVEGGFQLRAGLLRDVGRKRSSNQDFVSYFEPTALEELQKSGCIYVVADGVGGAIRGELASEYAVKALLHLYYQSQHLRPAERLAQIIPTIGNEIYTYAQQQGGTQKMATTMVVAIVLGTRLIVANVGDSRAYLIRGGIARQITQDHRQGENRLTRSVGGELNVRVDLFELDLQPGDRILLCSDGFHRYFSSSEIAQIVTEDEPYRVVYRMVEEANRRGGADNIAVAVVEVGNLVDWQEIPQTRYDIRTPLPLEERPTIADPTYWGEGYNYKNFRVHPSQISQQRFLLFGGLVLILVMFFGGAFLGTSLLLEVFNEKPAGGVFIRPSGSPSAIFPIVDSSTITQPVYETPSPAALRATSEPEKVRCKYRVNPETDVSFIHILREFGVDVGALLGVTVTSRDGEIKLCGEGGYLILEHCTKEFKEIIPINPNDEIESLEYFRIEVIIPNVYKNICEKNGVVMEKMSK